MSKAKFNTDVRVAIKSEKNIPFQRGKILTQINLSTHRSPDHIYVVELDTGALCKVLAPNLFLESEAIIEEKRIKKEQDRMEEEFELFQIEIENKMKTAANLIYEARSMAKKFNKELSEMYDETSSLVDAMSDAGWNTSSWGC